MQIKFEAHKLKAAKAYIAKLAEEESVPQKVEKPHQEPSLFQKIIDFLFK